MSDEEQPKDNIIAFPQVRRAAPAEPPPELNTDLSQVEASDTQDGLDAFERAVRQAVSDKLGSSTPRGADELVAQVFSALTGRDEQSALEEVRARLDEENNGKIIDFNSFREAREREAQDASARVKVALKEGFQQLMTSIAARAPQGAGGEIKLDAQFLKQHGNAILSNLFANLATALGQSVHAPKAGGTQSSDEAIKTTDDDALQPAQAPADAPVVTPQDTNGASATPVQVKLDLGSLLGAFFRKMTKVPPGSSET